LWRGLESIPPELLAPDIEWVNPPDAIETGKREGRSAFGEAESAFGRAYRSIEIGVERMDESGDGVDAIVDIHYHGRGSGIEVHQRIGMRFTIRDEQLARFEWSNDPEELLGDAKSA
jgi:ketosteroid isomerase-like protein